MPTIASGNSTPVRRTRNSEMPSTPRCHEIPHCSIQGCFETNWKPSAPRSNSAVSQIAIAPVVDGGDDGDELHVLGPPLGEQGDDQRADRRDDDQHRQDREAEDGVGGSEGAAHQKTPLPITNHTRSRTTPTPTMPA
jgi:hypothetical protein